MKKIAILFCLLLVNALWAEDFVIDDPSMNTGSSAKKEKGPDINHQPVISIGSVPTTQNLPKGKFISEFIFYDGGGITSRFIVGIFDILSIGISENFDNLIGFNNVAFNMPGAYIKLLLLKDLAGFNLSCGFDSFAYGRNGSIQQTNGNNITIYGFYASLGMNFSFLGGNDSINLGYRMPLYPFNLTEISNSSLYLGTSIGIRDNIEIGFTVENFFLDFNRYDRILPSVIISFLPVQELKLFVLLQYEFYSSRLNRILGLNYQAQF